MPHTHEFDCPICGAHLDSRKELDQHSRKEHTHNASSSSSGSDAKMYGKSKDEGGQH
jgi:uncharacterized C2H2 Zn-finger protein